MSAKTSGPDPETRDALYECPGALDKAQVFRPCGLQAVVTETGEDGWDGPYHCAKMTRVGPAPKVEE
jgi:hypothetical protein